MVFTFLFLILGGLQRCIIEFNSAWRRLNGCRIESGGGAETGDDQMPCIIVSTVLTAPLERRFPAAAAIGGEVDTDLSEPQ